MFGLRRLVELDDYIYECIGIGGRLLEVGRDLASSVPGGGKNVSRHQEKHRCTQKKAQESRGLVASSCLRGECRRVSFHQFSSVRLESCRSKDSITIPTPRRRLCEAPHELAVN